MSAIASKTRKLTSAAELLLSTASLNVKARLSRSYSTAATKRSMSRLIAFAKSQRGSHECRSYDLPRGGQMVRDSVESQVPLHVGGQHSPGRVKRWHDRSTP